MTSTATANPVLRGFYDEFMRDESGFVAELIAPTFNTAEQSARYFVFDEENLLLVPTNIERAPGAPHKEVSVRLSADSYFCDNYGLKIGVADEERKVYALALNADTAAIRRITDIIKVNRELRVKALVTNTATVQNASPAVKWNDAGSSPKADISAALEIVRKGIGVRVNTMIVSETVRLILEQHEEVTKMFQLVINGVLTQAMLQTYFGVPRIVVAGTVLATSKEGQALTSADIWGDDVLLLHSEPGQDMKSLNFARTFNWTGVGSIDAPVYSWRDDDRKSDMHAADHSTDEKLTSPKSGYLLTDVLA